MKMLFTFIFILSLSVCVFAGDIDDSLSDYDFEGFNSAYENTTGTKTDFKTLVKAVVTNDSESIRSALKELIISRIAGETKDVFNSLKILLVAAVLGGFFKNLISAFHDKETGEMGFAITYMITVGIALGAFFPIVGLMEDFCLSLTQITAGSLPLMLSVITASGRPASALAYNGLMSVCIVMIGRAVSVFVIPFINMSVVMCAVNYLSEEPMLEKLSDLLRAITETGIKAAAFIFTFFAGLNKLTSGLGNNVLMKGAKSAIGMVPIAGDIITGSVDTGLVFLNAVKSGVGIVFIIAVVVYAIAPILRVAAVAYAFKLLAGIIQPICDKRTVEFIDKLGDFGLVILSALFVVSYIFIFGALIFVAAGMGV